MMAATHSSSEAGKVVPAPAGTTHVTGRYTCTESLQTDGITTLFRGRDDVTGRAVLLKVVDPRRGGSADVQRLNREYEVAAGLHLAAVARPLGLDTHQGAPALVFEDAGAEPLDRAVATPAPLDRFLDLAVRIAAAVGDLHQEGVVHKDLKPQNILVHPTTLGVKLVGLGLATRPHSEQPSVPELPLIAGSLPYMSPEQAGHSHSAVDARSDLYSLGATFYQLLTGNLLCDAHGPLEWLHFHAARVPAPPARSVPDLPDMISRIVLRLLAKEAEDRYQTARGLERDLARCRKAWRNSGEISSFPLGEQDLCPRLRFPDRLYGRDEELGELLAALQRVAETGTSELVVVAGYSGVGKSTLARQLAGPAVDRNGDFVAGKADPYQHEVPYSTLAQAFGELILRCIAHGTETDAWRRRVQEALGAHGQLIADVVPQVEALVGRQQPVPDFAPAEARARFRTVFRRFVSALARPGHPLVLFLDDLHWIDPDSLPLLHDLVADPEVRFLLVVGAYRANEVTPAHPLSLALDAARAAGAPVTRMALGPLSDTAVTAFVRDTLRCPPQQAALLADIIRDKTAGNPFFTTQFLTDLHNDRLLLLDETTGAWTWDIDGLRGRAFTDNVAELMVERLRRLPEAAQQALRQVACLGDAAETTTLSWVLGASEDQLRVDLQAALTEGFLIAHGETYRFTHDTFREAVYSSIPEEARPETHLRIGRLLLAHLPDATVAERGFELANHLARGLELIRDPAERDSVRHLITVAGRRAKRAVAYAAAAGYLRHAADLLPPDSWRTRYDETLDLQIERCECEYLSGDFAEGQALCDEILRQARSDLDRARVHRLQIRMYELAGRNNEAMTVTAAALRLFGLELPFTPEDIQAATAGEERLVAEFLHGRRPIDLADAGPVHDPRLRAALGVIADSLSPAYMAQQAHFPLLAAMGVNICLRHGHTPESSSIYNSYALGRAGVADFSSAFDFSEPALRLLTRVEGAAARGIVLFRHAFFIQPWRQHLSTSLPYLRQSEHDCEEGGNLLYAGYARFARIEVAIEMGDPLDGVLQATRDAADLARLAGSDAIRDTLLIQQQYAACLQGGTREPGSLEGAAFTEADGVAGFATWRQLVLSQAAAYLFGRYKVASETGERAAKALQGVVALMLVATHHFYRALTLAALYPDASDTHKITLRGQLNEELRMHAHWADHCPANFAHRHALLAAEAARIDGRELAAERGYEQAIRSAREHGFVNYEALAYELAAGFYRAREMAPFADTYLREARACYLRWGAVGKVRQLDELHPQLAGDRAPVVGAIENTFEAGADQLDLLSVIKASQAISREIEVEQLVGTLLEIALLHSGASRGHLLLKHEGALAVQAEAVLDEAAATIEVRPTPPPGRSSLSQSPIVRRAQVTRQPVFLDEATPRGADTGDDPHPGPHRPHSIVALPILRGDDLLGLLYLENDLVSGAFAAPGLRTTLALLASQAAISMENALHLARIRELNQNLEQRVADRTAQLARANRRLADTNQDLEAFAYSVSHDLRAPIRHVQGFAELLAGRNAASLDAEGRRYLGIIGDETGRMRDLIDDLLSFSRTARQEMSAQRVDLGGLVREVVRRMEPETHDRAIEWHISELPTVTGDQAMLRVVLVNLIGNAVKFTRTRTPAEITIGATREENETVVFVRDNGVGFDPRHADKVFAVFQRLHREEDFEGTGIGLANVRRIIERHGGRAWAEAEADRGATFYFALPTER